MTRRLVIAPLAAALACGGDEQAGQAPSFRTFTAARQAAGEERLSVDVRFTVGRFHLAPEAGSALYRVALVYDETRFAPIHRYNAATARLRVGVDPERLGRNVDFQNRWDQRLELSLTPAVPTTLALELGAVQAQLELGGLAMRRVAVKNGASETRIAFSEPNRIPCEEFSLAVGAADLRATGLGNARCARLAVAGGAGNLILDFTGQWDSAAVARGSIKVGLGALTLRFPEDLGVEIKINRLLVSFDDRLDIAAALGNIEIQWEKT